MTAPERDDKYSACGGASLAKSVSIGNSFE
jgi:hypothetical protein